MGKISIVGMGPGDFGYLTMEAWEMIQGATNLVLRTTKHPTADEIRNRGVNFWSYDDFYENATDFESLYQKIVNNLLEIAQKEDIVYLVPGSPLVAERTVVLLRESASKVGISLEIIPGMSFLEVLYTRLGIDPIEGITIIDAFDLTSLPFDLATGIIITQVYNQAIASEVKLILMEYLPDDYEITYIHNLALSDESIRCIPLYELDRQKDIDHLTTLYLKPLPKLTRFNLEPLKEVMRVLRAPNGCPWDIEQTHESLRRNLIEETYEVIEAIDLKDENLLCEELGDLLLQIVFHARMAEETGKFSMQDVIDEITAKLIRRHPHVFGDVQVVDAGEVVLNWEVIKKEEKPERKSILDGVPKGLPALMAAEKLQKKARKAGFDWDDISPVWEKCKEEFCELKEAVKENNQESIEEEFGDLIFAFVNLARFLNVDSELATLKANKKFKKRFSYVEECVRKSGRNWSDFGLLELDFFWNEAKGL